MNNLSRKELIKALVKGLKLDDNIFNYQAVVEDIEQIQSHQFIDFYKAVMAENTYGNGLQAIMKVVERYKPQDGIDHDELKAKELIKLVEGMNHSIYLESEKGRGTFDDLLQAVSFPTIDEDTKAILANVRPFHDMKLLIKGIHTYQTSVEQIKAFKGALTTPPQAIGNRVKLMFEGKS